VRNFERGIQVIWHLFITCQTCLLVHQTDSWLFQTFRKTIILRQNPNFVSLFSKK